ncbi:MAG: amidohydrolase family protein [Oscillospiraceae bacterium]|nr:amidohydrolase family protein [Oscillospiraceae bacterium]
MIELINATLIDGISPTPAQHMTVAIDGNKISAIHESHATPSNIAATRSTPTNTDATRTTPTNTAATLSTQSDTDIIIDLKGKTIIPGLIDVHVHFGGADGFDRPGIGSRHETYDYLKSRTDALRHGITTVRSTGDYTPDILDYRDEVSSGKHISPRIVAAGKMIQARGGHPVSTVFGADPAIATGACVLVDENTDIVNEVRMLSDAGADWIKAFISEVNKLDYPKRVPRIPPETIKQIVETAHDCGKPCAIHVDNISHMREAALAGADCIEHVFSVGATDTEIDGDLLDLLVRSNIYVVPTVFSIKAHENPDGSMPLVYDKLLQQVNKLVRAGVCIGVGTDSNIPFVTLGESLHEEMAELVKCGMAPIDVVIAATSGNARLLRKDDVIGTIAPGYLADLVVVDGNPAADITATRNIELVISNGRIVYMQC